jgi:hypothetical protein
MTATLATQKKKNLKKLVYSHIWLNLLLMEDGPFGYKKNKGCVALPFTLKHYL